MKKFTSLLAAMLLLLAVVPSFAEGTAPQWMNSNIVGSVTAETEASLKDDFHLAVNKDWLVSTKIEEGAMAASTFSERNKELRQQILTLIKGDEQPSYEGKLVQRLFSDFMDMDARNKRGMTPVLPFMEEIEKIQTLDELTAYTQRTDQLCNSLFVCEPLADFMDSTHNALYIESFSFTLGDADEYKSMTSVGERAKQAKTALLQKLFERVGYTPEAASAVIEQMFALETEIASAALGSSDKKQSNYFSSIYNPMTMEELAKQSPTFPIVTMLKAFTDAGVEHVIMMDQKWLAKMNELYTQENLEAFKALLLCNTLRESAAYLDQECIDLMDASASAVAGITVKSILEDSAYSFCSDHLGMAIGRMYTENYVSPETKKDVENVIAQVVKIYKARLSNTQWLGEKTREQAILKLDHLRIRVAYPDDWSKYDVSDIVFPEGSSLLEDMLVIARHTHLQQIQDLLKPIDLDKWNGLSPQSINAFYSFTDNSINILAGILGGAFYDPQGSIEQTLGGIGVIIGHELTHGFDTAGSQYDQNGNMNNWWTDADRAAFVALTDRVDAYYSAIEALPGKFVDGQLTIGETVADLGGFSCMLEMAKGYENFDYELFFKTYARLWPQQTPVEIQEMQLQNVHAPSYLRANVTVQQFQEFYDTFDITPNDGMYLAPEQRLAVW
ncbi:MAG: M13 family metallopeptidase [Clostridia bacterium]